MHHGHNHWPSEITWNTWNSATYVTHPQFNDV
jgi:hypothetical protein